MPQRQATFEEHPRKYWESIYTPGFWNLPSCETPEQNPDLHHVLSRHLACRGGTLFEVGCAPGRFMAYFAKYLEMEVSGIDYVAAGAETTRQNLAMQGISAEVILGDFFTAELPNSRYDAVFSGGFIEHFPDTQAVVNRIVGLAKQDGGYVITVIPNFLGLNAKLRRHLAPQSYAGHIPIGVDDLRARHERCGVQTLFCEHAGLPAVVFRPDVSADGQVVNARAVRWVHRISRYVNATMKHGCRLTGWMPRTRLFSPSLIYVGQRRRAV